MSETLPRLAIGAIGSDIPGIGLLAEPGGQKQISDDHIFDTAVPRPACMVRPSMPPKGWRYGQLQLRLPGRNILRSRITGVCFLCEMRQIWAFC